MMLDTSKNSLFIFELTIINVQFFHQKSTKNGLFSSIFQKLGIRQHIKFVLWPLNPEDAVAFLSSSIPVLTDPSAEKKGEFQHL